MDNKIKFGKVEVPNDCFDEQNMTAHISIDLPLPLVKELMRISSDKSSVSKYKELIIEILSNYVSTKKTE